MTRDPNLHPVLRLLFIEDQRDPAALLVDIAVSAPTTDLDAEDLTAMVREFVAAEGFAERIATAWHRERAERN